MTRTHDLLITNQLLYRLSYTSVFLKDVCYFSTLFPVRQAGSAEFFRVFYFSALPAYAVNNTIRNRAHTLAHFSSHVL